MARWKAWLCRLAGAGSSVSTRVASAAASVPAVTAAMRPSGPTLTPTPVAHPSGSKARRAQIVCMSDTPSLTGILCADIFVPIKSESDQP